MVIQGALEMLAYELRTDSVEVTCEFAAGLSPLWADSHQLHQVLVNLIANAHHAMRKQPKPAPRRIRLASQLDREHQRVRLTGARVPALDRARGVQHRWWREAYPGEGRRVVGGSNGASGRTGLGAVGPTALRPATSHRRAAAGVSLTRLPSGSPPPTPLFIS